MWEQHESGSRVEPPLAGTSQENGAWSQLLSTNSHLRNFATGGAATSCQKHNATSQRAKVNRNLNEIPSKGVGRQNVLLRGGNERPTSVELVQRFYLDYLWLSLFFCYHNFGGVAPLCGRQLCGSCIGLRI